LKKTRNIFIIFLVLIFLVIGIGPRDLWSNAQQIYNKWMILTMILEKIERFYVDEKDPDNLLEDAIDGMLFGLDPHSTYLTPDEYKEYSKKYQGYFGFGLKYCRLDSHIVVTSLVQGGPADLAGVHVGDRIIKIAGKKTVDMPNDQLEQFLAQQEKLVTLLIQRPNQDERFSLDIVKRQVVDDTIPIAFMIQGNTAYVKISYFSNSTPSELDRALTALESAGMKQLVLDLRDNTGGTFDAGVAVADRFIPSGKMIVFTRGRAPQSSQQFIARINRYNTIPMVVLVNEVTASDAEIVSGALQDWDRAIIAGQKTYGKALVQTEYAFQDESVLLLTTARYFTPLGRLIQKEYNVDEKGAESKDKEPQQYKTAKGRVVYGGGGIQPDFLLKKTKQEFPKGLQPLYTRDENIFFKYADTFVASHADLSQQSMDNFVQHFSINSTVWNEFVTLLRQTKTSITQSDIQANAEFLKNELKVEIAGRLWGDAGRFAVITINDPDVKSGITYFDQATALLQK
jgi:carboxyl-terminal processing protease